MTIKDEAGPKAPPAVGEFAVQEIDRLRARLAKYEDADGNPLAALKQPSAGLPFAQEIAAFEDWRKRQMSVLSKEGAAAFYRLGSVQWSSWRGRARLAAPAGVPAAVRAFVEAEPLCSDCLASEICCKPALREAKSALAAAPTPAPAIGLSDSRVGRVYIAGPMTGYENYNFAAFNSEAERLRAQGLHVENPADHGVVDGADWADYLRYDIGRLASCERIHLLPGWSKSKGAMLEVHIAQALGMHIWYAEGAEPAPSSDAVQVPRELIFTIPKKRDLTHVSGQGSDVGHGWNLCVDSISKDATTFLDWAVERWHAEVSQRPLVNVHRRSLDDTWRQVIKRLGGDDVALCGPTHDDLLNGGRV